jgi:hypothetical protein
LFGYHYSIAEALPRFGEGIGLETGFLLGLAEVIAVEPETRFLCALGCCPQWADREE